MAISNPLLYEAIVTCNVDKIYEIVKWDFSTYITPIDSVLDLALEHKCVPATELFVAKVKPTERTFTATKGDIALLSLLVRHWPEEARRYADRLLNTFILLKMPEAAKYFLVELGADPRKYNALHTAAERCYTDLMLMMIDRGAGPNDRDWWGRTPLHYAGCAEAAKLLLERGADVNARDERGRTPLHTAVEGGRLDVMRVLLEAGADINARDEWGRTALHYAAIFGFVEGARLLREHGADPDIKDGWGKTPLDYARELIDLNVNWELADLLRAGRQSRGS
jgi:hypothetical protein